MKTVFLSAGHYPQKWGATYHGTKEHDLAVLLCNTLLVKLQNAGFYVEQVPTGHLPQKVDFINKNCDNQDESIAIEIHFNAGGDDSISGCEALYYPKSVAGHKLCMHLSNQIAIALGIRNRGAREGWYREDKEGGILDYFTSNTIPVAAIIEPEFIAQAAHWGHSTFETCADAIVKGIKGGI